MTDVPDDVLDRVERALSRCAGVSLVLRGNQSLNEPYPDDERWTPYTRWVEPASRKAYDAYHLLREARAEDDDC